MTSDLSRYRAQAVRYASSHPACRGHAGHAAALRHKLDFAVANSSLMLGSVFTHWGEFYLLVGSAAAVLIGLLFVVVTLMQDKPRSTMLNGAKYYMGPVVLHVSFVLVLSAAALAEGVTPAAMALICALIACWGFVRGVASWAGIRKLEWEEPPHWTDAWFYGAIPAATYIALAIVAWGFWTGQGWAVAGIAIVINAILLITIRNEWDLVTWLAPHGDTPDER